MRLITNILNAITSAKAKTAVAAIVLSGAVALPVVVPASVAYAAPPDTTSVCEGVALTGGGCDPSTTQFDKVIKLVIQVISLIAGIAAVIMIVVGGLRYITSGGDSSKVASAKSSIIYAIVGLIIVALAQIIVRFVITNAVKK